MSDFEIALMKMVQQEAECLKDHKLHGELNEYIAANVGDLEILLASMNHYFKQKAKEEQPNVAA